MGKIKDLMELNYWLGNRSAKTYSAVMENRRYLPRDKKQPARPPAIPKLPAPPDQTVGGQGN